MPTVVMLITGVSGRRFRKIQHGNKLFPCWIIKTTWNNYIYIYIYTSKVTLVWSWRAVGESSHTQRSCQGVGSACKKPNFSPNSTPFIILKLLRDPHGHVCSPLSPTKCLFSICHGLHQGIFYVSSIMPTHCFFFGSLLLIFIYDWMYLSTSSLRFTTGQSTM